MQLNTRLHAIGEKNYVFECDPYYLLTILAIVGVFFFRESVFCAYIFHIQSRILAWSGFENNFFLSKLTFFISRSYLKKKGKHEKVQKGEQKNSVGRFKMLKNLLFMRWHHVHRKILNVCEAMANIHTSHPFTNTLNSVQ